MTKTRSQHSRPVAADTDVTASEFQLLLDDLVAADMGRREQARQALVALRYRATEPLVAALATQDDRSRWKILGVLNEIGDKRAAAGVTACLKSASPAIRIIAAQFLGNVGAVEAVDALMDILRKDSDDQSTVWIIQALGRLGDRRAVALLVDIMHHTSSTSVRYTAIEALAAIGDARVMRDIGQYAADPSHHVKSRAINALEKLSQI
jgi:HEAT repeat protein